MWLAYTYEMGGHEWVSHEGWIENVAELDCKFIEAQSNVPGSNRMQLQMVGLDTRVYRRKLSKPKKSQYQASEVDKQNQKISIAQKTSTGKIICLR